MMAVSLAAPVLAACGGDQPQRTVVRTQTVTVGATDTAASAGAPLSAAENRAVDEAQQVAAAYCAARADGLTPRTAGLDQALETIAQIYRRGPIRRWLPPERPERDRTMVAVVQETIELLRLRGCSPAHAERLANVLEQTRGVGG